MRILLGKTNKMLRFNYKSIFIFEAIYRMFTIIAAFELMSRGMEFALRKAGYSYLTSKNLGPFLIRPYTIIVLIGLIVMEAFFLAIEVGAILTAYQGSLNLVKVNPFKMFAGGIVKVFLSLKKKNWPIFGVLLCMTLFSNAFMIFRVLSHVRPVNYLLSEIWRESAYRWILISVLALLSIYIIPNLFVLHACFIEKLSWKKAVNKSWGIVKKHFISIPLMVIGVNVFVVLGLILVYLVFAAGAGVTVVLFAAPNLRLAIMRMSCDSIEIFLIYFASIISIVVNYGMITAIYYKYAEIRYVEEDLGFILPIKNKFNKKVMTGFFMLIFAGYGFYIFNIVHSGTLLARKAILDTQITAHRGSSYFVPENTILALEQAMEDLADFSEIDLQETSDGVVVLLHDYSLKRTTGLDQKIWNVTYDQVAELCAGVQFGIRYEDAKIPTFEEVLILCKGKMNLNIELKNNGFDPQLPDKAVELIHKYDFVQQCVITSTNLSFLKKVKELDPDIKTGYILSAAYGKYYEDEAVDFISIRSSFVTENMVAAVHSYGKEVHSWTVNSKSELERMKLLGVDNIITDRPLYAREIVFREKATENLLEYISSALR